jgi:hypothetical protein
VGWRPWRAQLVARAVRTRLVVGLAAGEGGTGGGVAMTR